MTPHRLQFTVHDVSIGEGHDVRLLEAAAKGAKQAMGTGAVRWRHVTSEVRGNEDTFGGFQEEATQSLSNSAPGDSYEKYE